MFHARCDAQLDQQRETLTGIIADLTSRLDRAEMHAQVLEQDKRHLTAQLVEALKPLPQQQMTDDVIRDMLLPDVIQRAIDQVAGQIPGLRTSLDGIARQLLAQGEDESDIAERILHGDEEQIAPKGGDDLGFIPPTETVPDDEDDT